MKKMKKDSMVIGLLLVLFISACETSVVNKVATKETATPDVQQQTGDENLGAEALLQQPAKEPAKSVTPQETQKQSEAECRKKAEELINFNNPLLVVEEEKMLVTFTKTTTLQEALELLKVQSIGIEAIVKAVPISSATTDEEIFNQFRTIKGSVDKKKTIWSMCSLLNEASVKAVTLSTFVDTARVAQMAQQ